MDDDEMESESFYKFGGNDGDDDNGSHEEPEQLHVNRRVAEMDLHRRLNQSNSIDCEERDKGVLDTLRFHYAQRRWECLYDNEEHHRLREACMEQLHMNN